ncbi:hypothetical protein INT48_007055 [Thamnidium elegans]|uniref:Uncharacterized protein n=1 Tax=Thamnidium elegans TaxID=101142 RepID=A0A8H7VQ36_9FUNG|nr:hypothetical protein INT48_007055 [Thamnidium elegans]
MKQFGDNILHALKKVSTLHNQSSEDVGISSIYRFIFETHLFYPYLFEEPTESHLSEMDSLFLKTDIWSHWADTESIGCQYKFGFDLRLFCMDRISIVDFPCLKKSLIEGAGNFIDSFLKSKEMAVKTHEIVLKSSRNTRKTVEDLTPAELSRDSKLPRRILWLKPE